MCTIPWAFGEEVGRYWTKNGLVTIVSAPSYRWLEIEFRTAFPAREY